MTNKITNEEIGDMRVEFALTGKPGLFYAASRALDRLAELEARNEVLEAAVASKGFYEFPSKADCTIKTDDDWVTVDLIFGLNRDGTESNPRERRFIRSFYSPEKNRYVTEDESHPVDVRNGLWSIERLVQYGYVGWRYPVGDLS